MKLFIDARMLGNTGIGRYIQNIIEKIDRLFTMEEGIRETIKGIEIGILPAVRQ